MNTSEQKIFPLSNIPFDNEFKIALSGIVESIVSATSDNLDSSFMMVDYNVMRIKERARVMIKEYNERMEKFKNE